MRGAISPLPQYAFMAWCLVKHRDKFAFALTFTFLSECVTLYLEVKKHVTGLVYKDKNPQFITL
jgi:hypothetical protein